MDYKKDPDLKYFFLGKRDYIEMNKKQIKKIKEYLNEKKDYLITKNNFKCKEIS